MLPHVAVSSITKVTEFFLTLPVKWKSWFFSYFTIGQMSNVKLHDKIKSGKQLPKPQGPVSHADSVSVVLRFSPRSEHFFLVLGTSSRFQLESMESIAVFWFAIAEFHKTIKEVCWVDPGHQQSTHLVAPSLPPPTGWRRQSEEQK